MFGAGIPHAPGASSVGLSVQFIEIYNDKIRDLLHPGADSSAFRVREHPQTGPYVDNLVPVQVRATAINTFAQPALRVSSPHVMTVMCWTRFD